jgi:tetratricopeptide (TPR) repeat protein
MKISKIIFMIALVLIAIHLYQPANAQSEAAIKFFDAGIVYADNSKNDLAIVSFTEAIRLYPEYDEAWFNRGIAHKNKGEYDKAILNYTEAIRLDPEYDEAWYNRGIVYKIKGEYDKAIINYTEAIRLDPEFIDALNDRGIAYKIKGEYDKAILNYTEAIRLDPEYIAAWYNRGIAYGSNNEDATAILDYTKAISLKGDYIEAWNNRGIAYKNIGEYAKAILDFKEVMRLNPKFEKAYINILSPLVRNLQFTAAKEYYDEYKAKGLITYVDNNKKWSFFKYYIKAVTENIPNKLYNEALANLNTAVNEYGTEIIAENKSGYIDILTLKGYVLEQLQRNTEAIDIYNQTLVVNNNQPDVKEALQRLQKNQQVISQTDQTPPLIELISPQATRGLTIVAANETTQIIGRAKDPSGIATVTINDKVIKIEDDGLFITSISLKQGINNITITAVDKKGNTATKTFSLTGNVVAQHKENAVILPVSTGDKTPQYHAILIAEKDYTDPSIQDLENPVKDASELKSILENNYTFNSKNIETLYNKSREEIMQAIVQKSNSLTENDNLLIFYAGHGIAEKDKFGDVDGYWIPSSAKKGLNASYISSDDINKALKRSNSKHILVIADACFSGAFTRSLSSDASAGIQKQFSVPSRKIMASGNMEPVPDNSKFVFYLKKNLKENREKYLTAKKLFDSFYEAILNNSDTSPQYAAIKNVGDEGGEFVFIKK